MVEEVLVAEEKRLIPQSLLSRRTFVTDLKKLLSLTHTDLEQLHKLANGPDGFWPSNQSLKFAEQASVSNEDARIILNVAEYLYERAHENVISPERGAAELVEIGKSVGVDKVEEKRPLFEHLLATKEAYERGRRATLRATEVIAHFEDLDGTWDIRPVFHRESEEIIAKVPVLILNVKWHDSSGTSRDAVFQLAERDWDEFRQKIEKLEKKHEVLRRELDKA